MHEILTFPDQLRLIDERSAAFRAAVAAAPSLDVQMPTHPSRTLFDHVQHVGMGRRKAAAIVTAGPADGPPEESAWGGGTGAPRECEALLAWWVESVEHLESVLREAGPDRGCWTWWADSPSPQTSGAWARRQLHEIAVHTYDVQLTGDAPQPIPEKIALDGFNDCQFTLCDDGRLATRPRHRRLPRHRGPLLAPPAVSRRCTGRPPRVRCRRGPRHGRRRRPGHGQ